MTNTQFLKNAVNHLKIHAVETSPSVFEYADPADWDAEVILRNIISKITSNKRNAARRARHAAYVDLGMKRVRGGLGGVYYE